MRRPYDIHRRRARRRAARLVETIEIDIESGLQLIAEHLGAAALDRVVVCLVVNALALLGRERGFGRVATTLKAIERAHTYQERSLLKQCDRWIPDKSGYQKTQ